MLLQYPQLNVDIWQWAVLYYLLTNCLFSNRVRTTQQLRGTKINVRTVCATYLCYVLYVLLTWQWHPFYLCKNGHFSMSLVNSNHSADRTFCVRLWKANFPPLLEVFDTDYTAVLSPSQLHFHPSSCCHPLHKSLLNSLGTSPQKNPDLSSQAILFSYFLGFSNLVNPVFTIQAFGLKKFLYFILCLFSYWPISSWRASFVPLFLPGN